MHQPLINLAWLHIDLWGTRPDARDYNRASHWPWVVLVGETWIPHSKAVTDTAKYMPTSFGWMPRNPQETISSGYKAWEFLYYLYGLGPSLFYGILPEPYYSHYCRLVRAIWIIFQHAVSRDQLIITHGLLHQWVLDFEEIYCQRNPGRLHFVCQCVHSLTHLSRERQQLGPLWLTSQWNMERVIGYLGLLLRQPSNAFQNLAAQAQCVTISNTLVALFPGFEKMRGNPRGSKDLGDGYLLLEPKDATPYNISLAKQMALEKFFPGSPDVGHTLCQWGHLMLPTEQTTRSWWKEVERCSDMT